MKSLNPKFGQMFSNFGPYYENQQRSPEIQNSQKLICDTFSVKYVKGSETCK